MKKIAYHHGNLKEAIIKEALKILNNDEVNQFSFRHISRNIGVVSSAPYNHFKDKKQLLKELTKVGSQKLLEVICNEKKKSIFPTEQLLLVAKAYLDFSVKEKALFNLMFSQTNKELLYLTDKIVLQFEKIISEKFKAGKRLKLTEKGSAITAWTMIHGLATIINKSNSNMLEQELNIRLEKIFKEMTAIWGKGVSN